MSAYWLPTTAVVANLTLRTRGCNFCPETVTTRADFGSLRECEVGLTGIILSFCIIETFTDYIIIYLLQ